jgi:dephospho-CoA kinase
MTLKIGITGGIGSGKSTVCKVFKALGIPVYHADDSARTITDRNPEVIAQIKQAFGDDMYANGLLNRPKMAALVFNNPEELAKLNSIVHPAVRAELPVWLEANKNAPYMLYEAAILFESGAYKLVERRKLANYVIWNEGNAPVIAQVLALDKLIRNEQV